MGLGIDFLPPRTHDNCDGERGIDCTAFSMFFPPLVKELCACGMGEGYYYDGGGGHRAQRSLIWGCGEGDNSWDLERRELGG